MKRFQDLPKKTRDLIVIGSWVLLLIISSVIQASRGDGTTPIDLTQSFIITFLFIAATVLTTYAIKKNKKEKIERVELEKKLKKDEDFKRLIRDFCNNFDENSSLNEDDEKPQEPNSEDAPPSSKPRNKVKEDLVFSSLPVHGVKVRGTYHEDRQWYLEESEDGDDVIITHSPSESFYEFMPVENVRTGNVLGYIHKSLSKELINKYGEGCSFEGVIDEISGDEDVNFECTIDIIK